MKYYFYKALTSCVNFIGKIVDLLSDIKSIIVHMRTEWIYELKLINTFWTLSNIVSNIKLILGSLLSAYSTALIQIGMLSKKRSAYRESMYTSNMYINLFDLARVWNYVYNSKDKYYEYY